MAGPTLRRHPLCSGLGLGLLLLAASCGDRPETTLRLEALEAENAALKVENTRLDREADALNSQVRALQGDLKTLKKREALARLQIEEGQKLVAVLETNRGRIACFLFPEQAPETVLNFVQLAEGTRPWKDPVTGEQRRSPLYDGTLFHRTMPNFMIQGGDPEGTGLGGPGYNFGDEVDAGLGFDEPGMLAMANRGPGTNGSQFFITDRATPHHLDGKHTIFGKCENLDVVQAIAEAPRDSRDKPLSPQVLEKVSIIRVR